MSVEAALPAVLPHSAWETQCFEAECIQWAARADVHAACSLL